MGWQLTMHGILFSGLQCCKLTCGFSRMDLTPPTSWLRNLARSAALANRDLLTEAISSKHESACNTILTISTAIAARTMHYVCSRYINTTTMLLLTIEESDGGSLLYRLKNNFRMLPTRNAEKSKKANCFFLSLKLRDYDKMGLSSAETRTCMYVTQEY